MLLISEQLKTAVTDAIKKQFPDIPIPPVVIEYPTDFKFGDYSTPVALNLPKPPRRAADTLIAAIEKPACIDRIEIAGPGFINFFLASSYTSDFLSEIIAAGDSFGTTDYFHGKTVVTDTSHPNIAKPMAIHHILSTIIGNALNRIFAATGFTLIRDNYLGDYGTQFGKLMYAYKTWGDPKIVEQNPIPELLNLYVRFHEEVERDQSLEEKGRHEFQKLENGDRENRKLWQWVVDLSLAEFRAIYDRLDVEFDFIHGESFYEDKMEAIIELGKRMGVFVMGERGALIAPLDAEGMPPCLIKKSDGATLYATRDLARTKYWEDAWHPDFMIIVTDVAQELHFRQFFAVAKKLKITDAENIHVQFGRMSFPEKKMSTRKGNIISLKEVLDDAEEQALAIVREKNPDLPAAQMREIAQAVGIGAVKYAVLSQNRTTNITFTWDKILALDGNSAPYIQYAHARACSLLRKAAQEAYKSDAKNAVLTEPAEIRVARMLPRFPEIIIAAAKEYKPNYISNYLFALASAFNGFYAELPVLKAKPEARASRLHLADAVRVTLKNGLQLLGGINAPEVL